MKFELITMIFIDYLIINEVMSSYDYLTLSDDYLRLFNIYYLDYNKKMLEREREREREIEREF